jgi:hypothetical protein
VTAYFGVNFVNTLKDVTRICHEIIQLVFENNENDEQLLAHRLSHFTPNKNFGVQTSDRTLRRAECDANSVAHCATIHELPKFEDQVSERTIMFQ